MPDQPSPSLVLLAHDEYIDLVWKEIKPGNRPWWMRLSKKLGLEHHLYPKAFADSENVYCERGYDTPERLAHEWLHHQPNDELPEALRGADGDGDHPKGLANFIDVAGVSPLRLTDRWGLVERSQEWRAQYK